MKVVLLNPQEPLFEGFASEVVLPVLGGELSILDDHEPFFAALGEGRVCLRLTSRTMGAKPVFVRRRHFAQGMAEAFSIRGGVARMKSNELVILVE